MLKERHHRGIIWTLRVHVQRDVIQVAAFVVARLLRLAVVVVVADQGAEVVEPGILVVAVGVVVLLFAAGVGSGCGYFALAFARDLRSRLPDLRSAASFA